MSPLHDRHRRPHVSLLVAKVTLPCAVALDDTSRTPVTRLDAPTSRSHTLGPGIAEKPSRPALAACPSHLIVRYLQIRALMSPEPVAKKVPVGLGATEMTEFLCP